MSQVVAQNRSELFLALFDRNSCYCTSGFQDFTLEATRVQAKCGVVHACAVGGTRRRAVRDSAARYGRGLCAHAQNGWMKGGRMGGDLSDIEHRREADGG